MIVGGWKDEWWMGDAYHDGDHTRMTSAEEEGAGVWQRSLQ